MNKKKRSILLKEFVNTAEMLIWQTANEQDFAESLVRQRGRKSVELKNQKKLW